MRAASTSEWCVEWSPCSLASVPRPGDGEGFFWESPERGLTLIGSGVAIEIVAGPDAPFTDAARELARLGPRIGSRGPALFGGALFAGGFAFDPARLHPGHPAGRLVLPRQLWVGGPDGWSTARVEGPTLRSASSPGESSNATGPRLPQPETDESFRARVEAAVYAIHAGAFSKVVLARAVERRRPPGLGAREAIERLRAGRPDGARFAFSSEGASLFLGATPERLVSLEGRRVSSASVAGTAARGADAATDAARTQALLESKKDHEEHALVTDAIRSALAPLCADLDVPETPQVMRMAGLQHLYTPVSGTLRDPATHVLDLVAALHPTPAVGGSPAAAALPWLRDHERLARGWYAGPVGFVGLDGGGEWAVALRSALLTGSAAYLFAGAGIVRGSDAEAELAETRLKLGPMLEVLGAR